MEYNRTRQSVLQLAMPGMPTLPRTAASYATLTPGQEVVYLGHISGGPRYGSRGVVRQTHRRKAVVDLGRSGTWHIPYYFLGVPTVA